VAAVVLAVVVTLALTRGDDPDATAEDQSPTQQQNAGTSPSGQASKVAASGPVTCWDHSEAASSLECPVPVGRDAMTTVFPGLASTCTEKESPIEGKAEVYECVHSGFLVRYTRWDVGVDKEKYYEVENAVPGEPWEVGGEQAGLQWFSIEEDPEEEDPYQWSAAYAGLPFSLSVEGESQADRSAGLTELELLPPSQVGLAPAG